MEVDSIIAGPSSSSDVDMYYDAPEIPTYNDDGESERFEIVSMSDGVDEEVPSLGVVDGTEGTEAGEIFLNRSDDSDVIMVENEIGVSEAGNMSLETKILKPRTYQLEMLEESLKRNIIVAVSAEISQI